MRYLGAATLAAVFFGSAQVSATPVTLFDSITGSTANAADNIYSAGPLYASFSTGSSAATLTEIDVMLNGGTSGSGETVSVSLFSSNESSTPYPTAESLLASLGSINSVSSGDNEYSLNSLSDSLVANTRYWIELTSNASSVAGWDYTSNTSGTGVSTEYWQANYTPSPGSVPNAGNNQNGDGYFPNPYEMIVTADQVGTTPLPATLPLFASGLGAIGLLGWRRKRKAQAAA
jgi:hypothetical protein